MPYGVSTSILSAPTGHAPYNSVNLAALDEETRSQSTRDVRAGLERLAAIGTSLAVVHPTGFSPDYLANRSP